MRWCLRAGAGSGWSVPCGRPLVRWRRCWIVDLSKPNFSMKRFEVHILFQMKIATRSACRTFTYQKMRMMSIATAMASMASLPRAVDHDQVAIRIFQAPLIGGGVLVFVASLRKSIRTSTSVMKTYTMMKSTMPFDGRDTAPPHSSSIVAQTIHPPNTTKWMPTMKLRSCRTINSYSNTSFDIRYAPLAQGDCNWDSW